MKFWHTKRGHATFLLVMDVLSVLLAETIAFFVTDTAPFGREILLWMGANVALTVLFLFLAQGYAVVFSLTTRIFLSRMPILSITGRLSPVTVS